MLGPPPLQVAAEQAANKVRRALLEAHIEGNFRVEVFVCRMKVAVDPCVNCMRNTAPAVLRDTAQGSHAKARHLRAKPTSLQAPEVLGVNVGT